MNKFEFQSVGQGLCYTGSIDMVDNNYNFMFDCGTGRRKVLQSQALSNITSFYGTDKDIEFIAISHLHSDHINLLSDIVKTYNVKDIYLPYLGFDPDVVKAIMLYSTRGIKAHVELSSLLFSAYAEAVIHGEWLYQNENKNDNDIDGKNKQWRESSAEQKEKMHLSKYAYVSYHIVHTCKYGIHSPYCKGWEFKIINNPKYEDKIDDLVSKLRAIIPAGTKVDVKWVSSNLKQINAIYNKVFGQNKINDTSMLLYHKPTNENLKIVIKCKNGATALHNTGTMLTGDAVFNEETKALLEDRMLEVGIMQLPHHGSCYNWNAIQAHIKAGAYVASYGLNNSYSHPSKQVILDIISNEDWFYRATDNKSLIYAIM